ncbi:MAG TPA: hypothetical protein VII81_00960, partial [Terriglobales bacterium]
SNCSWNFFSAAGLSGDTPTITAPLFSNFLCASRNSDASMFQPGVLALGKKYRTRVLPRKSFNDLGFPSWSGKLKSGALSWAGI